MSKSQQLSKKTDNSRVPEPIYVVGYPKSGNTWLTRLLADLLNAPVCSRAMRGNLELASEINTHLSFPSEAKYEVHKIHFLSKIFFKEINAAPTRIVYIFRDIRDVIISGFFYHKKGIRGVDPRIKSLFSMVSSSPAKLIRYIKARRKMMVFVNMRCVGGPGSQQEDFGLWSQHIADWRCVRNQRDNFKIAFISYEELLKETKSTMLKVLHELNLQKPSEERLRSVIDRQSFRAQETYFKNLSDDAQIPFGKHFNLHFLRKGSSGDWKNYLSCRMGKIIHKYH